MKANDSYLLGAFALGLLTVCLAFLVVVCLFLNSPGWALLVAIAMLVFGLLALTQFQQSLAQATAVFEFQEVQCFNSKTRDGTVALVHVDIDMS